MANGLVLLVDDDPAILRSLGRTLNECGIETIDAASAHDAMAILKRYQVDVIVCDNQMTGITGTKFLETVRRNYPDITRMMLTGQVSPSQRWLLEREIGVHAVFMKPCPGERIVSAIRDCLVPGA